MFTSLRPQAFQREGGEMEKGLERRNEERERKREHVFRFDVVVDDFE